MSRVKQAFENQYFKIGLLFYHITTNDLQVKNYIFVHKQVNSTVLVFSIAIVSTKFHVSKTLVSHKVSLLQLFQIEILIARILLS